MQPNSTIFSIDALEPRPLFSRSVWLRGKQTALSIPAAIVKREHIEKTTPIALTMNFTGAMYFFVPSSTTRHLFRVMDELGTHFTQEVPAQQIHLTLFFCFPKNFISRERFKPSEPAFYTWMQEGLYRLLSAHERWGQNA